jgi:ferredoxin--NADP+ reductase
VCARDLALDPASESEVADRNNLNAGRNLEIFRGFAARPPGTKRRRCFFHFLASPVELQGRGSVERVVLARNRLHGEPSRQVAQATGETIELPCGLVFRSIGYRGAALPGVPFDARRGVFPSRDGRLLDGEERPIAGLYATGWIKRGPTGIIGTNRADSIATVASLLADMEGFHVPEAPGLDALLATRGVRAVSYPDWLAIDAAEVQRGRPKGKPREKFTRVGEMLACL